MPPLAPYWLVLVSSLAAFAAGVPSDLTAVALSIDNLLPRTTLGKGEFSLQTFKYSEPKALARRGSQFQASADSKWLLPISLGTPAQKFLLLADTGSNSLYFESELETSSSRSTAARFDPSKSSTAKVWAGGDYRFSECYGGGYCLNGIVYSETLTLGGFNVPGMPVALKLNSTKPFSAYIVSGILGLNVDHKGQSTSPGRLPSFFQTIKDRLNKQLFAVNYHRSTSDGSFDFGFINTGAYTGSLDYTSVVDTTGFWRIGIQGYGAGAPFNTQHDQAHTMFLDTGAGQSRWPASLLSAWFTAYVPGASYNTLYGRWQYPCSHTLPDFHFTIGPAKTPKTIPSSFIYLGKLNDGICLTNLAQSSSESDNVLGQDFIEALYVVFDWAGNRVGFANKNS